MAYIRQIAADTARGPLQRVYAAAMERVGGIANIIRIMSLDGYVCQASMQMYTSLMKRDNALEPATREMLATVVSHANDCYY